MKDNLKIPYGVSDFKRVISEGYYYIDKSAYIRTLEEVGSFLFPERYRFGDVQHSYLIELKYSAKDAVDFEIEAKRQEALEQLARYRADRSGPSLARGTTLHQIVFQFRGTELVRCEHVAEEELL